MLRFFSRLAPSLACIGYIAAKTSLPGMTVDVFAGGFALALLVNIYQLAADTNWRIRKETKHLDQYEG